MPVPARACRVPKCIRTAARLPEAGAGIYAAINAQTGRIDVLATRLGSNSSPTHAYESGSRGPPSSQSEENVPPGFTEQLKANPVLSSLRGASMKAENRPERRGNPGNVGSEAPPRLRGRERARWVASCRKQIYGTRAFRGSSPTSGRVTPTSGEKQLAFTGSCRACSSAGW